MKRSLFILFVLIGLMTLPQMGFALDSTILCTPDLAGDSRVCANPTQPDFYSGSCNVRLLLDDCPDTSPRVGTLNCTSGCGLACPSGETWDGDECYSCLSGQSWDGDNCYSCALNETWNGSVCITDCTATQIRVNGVCKDLWKVIKDGEVMKIWDQGTLYKEPVVLPIDNDCAGGEVPTMKLDGTWECLPGADPNVKEHAKAEFSGCTSGQYTTWDGTNWGCSDGVTQLEQTVTNLASNISNILNSIYDVFNVDIDVSDDNLLDAVNDTAKTIFNRLIYITQEGDSFKYEVAPIEIVDEDTDGNIDTVSIVNSVKLKANNIEATGDITIESGKPRIILEDIDGDGSEGKMAIRSTNDDTNINDGLYIQGRNEDDDGWNDLVYVDRVSGNVGIGTGEEDPGSKLHVKGDLTVEKVHLQESEQPIAPTPGTVFYSPIDDDYCGYTEAGFWLSLTGKTECEGDGKIRCAFGEKFGCDFWEHTAE